MSAPADSRRFRAAREAEWRRLDQLLTVLEKKSPRALSDEDLMALPVLYRGALSSLSVARETSLDLELVTWLESLCARAYFFLYGVRTSPLRRLGAFFQQDWPNAVRDLWRETLIAVFLLSLGAFAAFILVSSDPDWFTVFVPQELGGGRDFSASAASLKETLYDRPPDGRGGWLGVFATSLFTHNSAVAITCFALGFAFGVPTALLLVYNGTVLGAFFALFAFHGLSAELAGWLMIHGTTELFAIAIAGAAGLRIGWSVVFPGEASRLASATRSGRTAATAMAGVVIMLFAAGLLEGVGRQTITDDLARYAIGSGMLALWCAFFYTPRRRRNA